MRQFTVRVCAALKSFHGAVGGWRERVLRSAEACGVGPTPAPRPLSGDVPGPPGQISQGGDLFCAWKRRVTTEEVAWPPDMGEGSGSREGPRGRG